MKKIKRFTLTVLVLLIVVSISPLFAKATSISQTSAVAWAQGKIGSGLNYDGAHGNQCVDLIYYYYSYLGVTPVGGNACDYASNTLPAGWTRITSNIVPQPGDIAVWKSYYNDGIYTTSWAGHIGIVVSGNSSTFNTIHQNYNETTTCIQSNNIPTKILACVIRPNFSSTSSDPTITWLDYAEKHSIGSTNAVLARKCDLNGMSITAVSKVGIYLYDYNNTLLDSFSEAVSFGNYTYFTLWYDINGELGYKLLEGTTYKYKFMAEINNKTYYSPVYTFQTKGTHTHKYNSGTVSINATCTSTGTRVYTCTTCGRTKTETIPTMAHKYSTTWTIDTAATCTTNGSKSQHCTQCGTKRNITPIVATGHVYSSWLTTINATCTKAGTQKRTCSKCSSVQTESISALGHNYASTWTTDIKATCTTAGSKSHHCTRCDSKANITAISATGHTWTDWIVTVHATETNTGLKTRTCKNGCGTQENDIIAKLTPQVHTHTFGEWIVIVEPSCTEHGIQQKKCTECEKTEQQTIAAIGHNFGQWQNAAQEGLAERICTKCSTVEIAQAELTDIENTQSGNTQPDTTQPTHNNITVTPTEPSIAKDNIRFSFIDSAFIILCVAAIIILGILIIALVVAMLIVKFKKRK